MGSGEREQEIGREIDPSKDSPAPLSWSPLGHLLGTVFILTASKIKCRSADSAFLLSDLREVTQPLSASVSSSSVESILT